MFHSITAINMDTGRLECHSHLKHNLLGHAVVANQIAEHLSESHGRQRKEPKNNQSRQARKERVRETCTSGAGHSYERGSDTTQHRARGGEYLVHKQA